MEDISNTKIRNKTYKKREKIINSIKGIPKLTKKQQDILCKTSANTYNTFEDKVEEVFKKNKIDIVSTSYNLEKQIVKNLKKAVNTKNIKPNDDFYSYINDRWIADYEVKKEEKYIVQIDGLRCIAVM